MATTLSNEVTAVSKSRSTPASLDRGRHRHADQPDIREPSTDTDNDEWP